MGKRAKELACRLTHFRNARSVEAVRLFAPELCHAVGHEVSGGAVWGLTLYSSVHSVEAKRLVAFEGWATSGCMKKPAAQAILEVRILSRWNACLRVE